MAGRPGHPNKEIEAAVAYAEEHGWRVNLRNGHAHPWARLLCPAGNRTGCQISVWGTPKNPTNHARHIMKLVDKCVCDNPNGDENAEL